MNQRLLFTILGSWFLMSGTILRAQTQDQDVAQLLERGHYLEETKKDLAGAMIAYQAILENTNAHPEITMQARFRLASCQLKTGDTSAAKATLQGMIDAIPDSEPLAQDDKRARSLDRNFAEIVERALPDIDRESLLDAAFEGVVERLGNRANYLDTSELANFRVGMDGKLTGIGALMTEDDDGRIFIKAAFPDTPANEAGLQEGDEVIKVNDRDVSEFRKGLSEVVNAIRGKKGTTVSLTIRSHDSNAVETIGIVRRSITLTENPPVASMRGTNDSWMIDEGTGIAGIRIRSFSTHTSTLLRNAVEESLELGMKALVLDLRDNGGGSLDESIKIADMFVTNGVIVRVVSRNQEPKDYLAQANDTWSDFPMVVLVNGNTASAAEILAACLQDHHRAVIIGSRTMGVGTVRSMMPVAGGGALVLPISTFERPSGAKVQARPGDDETADWGVRPDDGFAIKDSDPTPEKDDKPVAKALQYLRGEIEN